jgi:LysR family nitrogen assimilation transcriptional regulator
VLRLGVNSIDIRQIRCFVAACEEGSFSKAAKRENSTQSGVSVCIQQLESTLSHKLFDRVAVGVTPTLAGRHFYECSIEILRAMKAAQQRMVDIGDSFTGVINLGFPPSIFKSALPSMLADYVAAHPFVDFRLAEAYSGTLTDWVISGEIDAAIVTKPPTNLGLDIVHFFRDRLVLVTRKGSLVAPEGRNSHGFGIADLQKLKLILPSPRHSLRQVIEDSVPLNRSGFGKILEIDGQVGTLELVQKSDWATIAAESAVISEVKAGRLDSHPISEPELWHDLFLIQLRENVLPPVSKDFLDNLRKVLGSVVE